MLAIVVQGVMMISGEVITQSLLLNQSWNIAE